MYIKAYVELPAYSGIFRTVDIFSQFHARYPGITQELFMHILNLVYADSGIFTTPAYWARTVSRIFGYNHKVTHIID